MKEQEVELLGGIRDAMDRSVVLLDYLLDSLRGKDIPSIEDIPDPGEPQPIPVEITREEVQVKTHTVRNGDYYASGHHLGFMSVFEHIDNAAEVMVTLHADLARGFLNVGQAQAYINNAGTQLTAAKSCLVKAMRRIEPLHALVFNARSAAQRMRALGRDRTRDEAIGAEDHALRLEVLCDQVWEGKE